MAQSGNITRTPDLVLTDSENITNAKINRAGGGTYRVDAGSITERELSASLGIGNTFGTVTDIRANTIAFTDNSRIQATGYYADADGGFGPLCYYDENDSSTTDDGLTCFVDTLGQRFKRSFENRVQAEWAGAKGDGVNDDTNNIQTILNLNKTVVLGIGKYKVTSNLTLKRSSGIIGETQSIYPGTAQTGQTWDGKQESLLWFDGTLSDTAAMLFASAEAVGTEVASSFDNTIYGVILKDFVIDGNNKAGFGLYTVRPYDWEIDNISVIGTRKHGMYICGAYAGRFSKIHAFANYGCGISIGRGAHDYEWTINYAVNACLFEDIKAQSNGLDEAFDETTNKDWGYGIGLYWHRANVMNRWTSENNDGVGLYIAPSGGPNTIQDGYAELNCYSTAVATDAVTDSRATQGWGIWFEGMPRAGVPASSGSLHCKVDTVFLQGGANAQGVKLEGTEPSSGRPEGAFELGNAYPSAAAGGGFFPLVSSWGYYRLVNCSNEINDGISGTEPSGEWTVLGGVGFGLDALQNYDEGTWTPSLEPGVSGSYTQTSSGKYTHIGNRVFYNGKIIVTGSTSPTGTSVKISGLPLASSSGGNNSDAGGVAGTYFNMGSDTGPLTLRHISGTTTLNVFKSSPTGAVNTVPADFTNTSVLIFFGQYSID